MIKPLVIGSAIGMMIVGLLIKENFVITWQLGLIAIGIAGLNK